jgi:dipeptidyl aminopeptidase/acylaminoacyl peptidase
VDIAHPDRIFKLPVGHDVTDLSISAAGDRLVYTQKISTTNIWRLDLTGLPMHAEKIVSASREQTAPDISPDGRQIVFQSNRTGAREIWICDADGSNVVQLTSFGTLGTGTPRWSPDGKWIAFDSTIEGESNIYLIDPRGGVPLKLAVDIPGNSHPSWSHDAAWIYFTHGGETSNPTAWIVPSQGGKAVQITTLNAKYPRESPDGQFIYFEHEGSLWRVWKDRAEVQKVEGMPPLSSQGEAWFPFQSRIYFLNFDGSKYVIEFLDLTTKMVHKIHEMEKRPTNWVGNLPVSSDGKWLLFPQRDDDFADLMMIENWK